MTIFISRPFYRLQRLSFSLCCWHWQTFSVPSSTHLVIPRGLLVLLLLSELEKVLQSDVNPPLGLLHLPDVEVDVQWGAGGGGVTAVGVTDHLTEILGDVETPPLVDLKVGFVPTLDQHHIVVGLDDRAVGIPTRKTSWKNSTSRRQKKSGDRGVRKGQVGMRKFN